MSREETAVDLAPLPRQHGFAGCVAISGVALELPGVLYDSVPTSLPTHRIEQEDYCCISTQPGKHDTETGHYYQLIGSPRWADSDLQQLAQAEGHAAALQSAHRRYGENLTARIRGAYAIAIVDTAHRGLTLCSDRMGRIPVYFRETAERLIFATSAAGITALSGDAQTDPQGLYDYMYFHVVPAPRPVYRNMRRLQRSRLLSCSGGKSETRPHWLPEFAEGTTMSSAQLQRELRDRLKSAVAAAVPATGRTGAFLSGGLDSSTVAGMLAELSGGGCHAYSIGFSAPGYDEMSYARATAKHFGITLHEYYVTPEDVVETLPLIAAYYDEPFGNSSALPAYFCARLAADDGISTLLAGDGGDELFAGNERYAKQKVFEIYEQLPAALKSSLIEPLTRNLPSWVPLAGKANSYLQQAKIPLPERLQSYNFLHRNPPEEIFSEDFLHRVSTNYPLELQRQIYNEPEQASHLNRMLYLDWQLTLADNDLRKVNQTCALAGIDVAYPMLDDDLVEFSCRIPSTIKLPGNKLRDFYKRALSGWLPELTINKSKQGFGLPFGVWMRTHAPLREMAYDSVSALKARKLFQDAFIDRAIAMHRDGHAAYYGELIWILCTLELWLSHRQSSN